MTLHQVTMNNNKIKVSLDTIFIRFPSKADKIPD
jgi:hypothetical protein